MDDDGKSREELLAEVRELRTQLALLAAGQVRDQPGETTQEKFALGSSLEQFRVKNGVLDTTHLKPGTGGWYRALCDSIDEGFCTLQVLFDPDGNPVDYWFLEVNAAFEKHTGLKDAAGKRVRDLVPNLDESWFRIYGEVASTRKAIRFENRDPALDRWFDVFAFPMGHPEERMITLIFRDISDKKAVEEEHRRMEERTRLLNKATNDVIWEWDMVTHELCWHGPVAERLGIKPESTTDFNTWVERLHPEDRADVLESLLTAIERGEKTWTREYRFRKSDGFYLTLLDRGYIARDEHGTAYRMVGSSIDVTGRRLAEDALRLSEAKLQAVIEALPLGIGTSDGSSRTLSMNRAALKIHGFRTQEEMLETMDEYSELFELRDANGVPIPQEDWPAARAMRGDYVNDLEVHLRRRDTGEEHVLLYSVILVRGETRWLPRFVFLMQDITQRKAAEAAMDQARAEADAQRRLLDAILESLPVGVVISDPKGRIVRWNQATEKLWGIDRANPICTHSIQDFAEWKGWWPDTGKPLRSEDWAMARSLLYREVVTGELIEIEPFDRPGERRVIINMGAPVLDRSGNVMGAVVAHTDITERMKMERQLRESEERFRALADNIPQLACMMHENGYSFWYNQRWLEYTGASVEDLQGWGWRDFVHPDLVDTVFANFQGHIATGTAWEDTISIRSKDGSYRWFLARAVPIKSPDGKITRWFASLTDITAQREARQVMQQAKDEAERASRAKDEFLAGLSHELRTPLTPVLMAAQMLEAEPSLPEWARDDLTMLRRNVELETRLIDDLLDLTRISRGKLHIHPTATCLHSIVRHAAATCLHDTPHRQNLRLDYDLAAKETIVWGDPVRLGQIFWNIMRNAVKFTADGGRISIRSRNLNPRLVEVTVADTGIGIDPAVLPHIFNAFEQGGAGVTRQFGGLGLGLAICRSLAELHGGKISAYSAGQGAGAAFTLELPVLAADDPRRAAAKGPADGEADLHPQTSRKILLVEDHDHTAAVLEKVLTRMGHEVCRAATVSDALAQAASQEFSFVLSDVGLPDGSGHDLMRLLREKYGLRGIALSGYGMEDDLARSREAGFEEHLVKPVDLQQLSAAIRRIEGR